MTSSPSPSTENHSSDVVTDAATLSKTKDLSSDHIDNNDEEEEEEEEEEDEEGDIDFNPFLKDPPSLEPSSSLSSDIEEFHADVDSTSQHHHHHHHRPPVENTEHSQQTVTQVPDSYDTEPNKPIVASDDDNDDDEDAIWRRTRARYSLVGSTLDELETFLQETDDEDDLHHNIDDEQEYRKFLAAVLQQDGDPSLLATQATENLDEEEEDEDNDADFELELEEALESDIDERRPETRHQKKRQKTDVHNKKDSKKETNNKNNNNNNSIRPLRPILPYAPISHSPYMMIQNTGLTSKECPTPFMPHQIGQLHCLIYEHVQLLVQVFSLSVLEPSRQHIASQLHGLLLEIVNKRDRVLASRKVPYPSFCFSLPYIQSTVSLQNNMSECEWVPFVTENVTSVIDVAPLNLVGSYLTDVSNVVHEHQRRRLEVAYDGSNSEDKECLFPFGNFSYLGDSDQQPSTTAGSSRSNEPRAKKTIAATAVEKSRMQSIAFVPKEIARLALQFFPLFNPALFPHKPPPVSVANRFLFTDAEDGLLARGLMEYNTNWKEIQKHFLPCKTPHQIFVRQKNRACSRAPENPIKAVRRWKTSPLSPQEKALIEEGLRVYKLDWKAVWKYMVPHRDPTLLARQYRTAVGNQKSYKGDELKKAKRRSYESNRRKLKLQKSTNKEGWSTEDDTTPIFTKHKQTFVSENAPEETNSGEDNDNETYVHEAFLSDWRPENHDKLPNYPRMVNYHQHPYRARKSNGSRVVKLAPDLPPVNLPPSVRIMSQSAFSKYNEVSSSNNKYGQLEERNSSNTTGKGDSDHQMHPLLFHDNEDASLPYYPLNPPVDFFPNNNNNLFRYSHQEKHTVNFFNNVKSKELEFHPLLQRTEDGIGDSGVVIPVVGKESVTRRSPSELDLDIRLSSSVRNRGLRDGIGDSGVGNDGIVMEQEELSDSEEEEEDVDESVEFECEEMTDSEGGSDSDHFENVQNQDVEGEGTTSTCKSDVAVGLSLNNHRNSRSSKSTTLETPPPPQVKKPRKRAQKQVK